MQEAKPLNNERNKFFYMFLKILDNGLLHHVHALKE